jgi:hypothetical protein
MIKNGFLRLNGDEVAQLVEAPHPSCWWINTTTGETHITNGRYDHSLPYPEGCVYLMGTDPVWIFQWAGDWQRAADEQLNPLLTTAFPNPVPTPPEETTP